MKQSLVMLFVLFLALGIASGQNPPAPSVGPPGLGELKKQFETTLTELQRQEREAAKQFQQRYLAGLSALEESRPPAGSQLAVVVVVRAEKERFERSGNIPDSALADPASAIRKLQDAWRAQTAAVPRDQAQKFVAVCERYVQSLALLQKTLSARNDTNGVAGVIAEKERVLGGSRLRDALAVIQALPPAVPPSGSAKPVPAPAASKSSEKGTKCRLYWSCADDADVYLNGQPLRDYTPDFNTRPDEANQEFSVEARVAKGDIITVGARRGGSFGFLMVIVDENEKIIFKTSRTWRVYYPADNKEWYLPATAVKSKKGMVSINPQPWPPQGRIQARFHTKALSIWDHQERLAFLTATVE